MSPQSAFCFARAAHDEPTARSSHSPTCQVLLASSGLLRATQCDARFGVRRHRTRAMLTTSSPEKRTQVTRGLYRKMPPASVARGLGARCPTRAVDRTSRRLMPLPAEPQLRQALTSLTQPLPPGKTTLREAPLQHGEFGRCWTLRRARWMFETATRYVVKPGLGEGGDRVRAAAVFAADSWLESPVSFASDPGCESYEPSDNRCVDRLNVRTAARPSRTCRRTQWGCGPTR